MEQAATDNSSVATVSEAPLKLSKLDEDFLNRFKSIVEENITNVDLDMTFVQNALNMSNSTIYRKIKGLTGMSGNEFIRKIRLKHGYEFLCDGCNVTEAAYSCGFGDVKHFRNSFKDEYGVTPSQFIKDLKSKRSQNLN
jgi:two-component system sensor histidine kinase/response regulator